MRFIWVARGRTWGFRFLRNGGFEDPLPMYDEAFSGYEADPEVFRRLGRLIALRFTDPLMRKDRAGRVIQHDFVVFAPLADEIHSIQDGLDKFWPLVADEYARIWELPKPPK